MELRRNARSFGCESATTLAAHFDPLSKSMARMQTGPSFPARGGPPLAVRVGLVLIREKLFESGSKCAAKVVAPGHVAARAKLQAVPLGVCKVEDHPRGCHSVGHLACAGELRALPSKEAKMAAVRSAHTLLPKRTGIVSKMRESGAGIPIAGGTWLQLRTATWARPARP